MYKFLISLVLSLKVSGDFSALPALLKQMESPLNCKVLSFYESGLDD